MEKKCSITDCQKESRAKGLCLTHYSRLRKGITDMRVGHLPWQLDDSRYKKKGLLCSVEGCNKTFYAKRLCHNHYELQRRNGKPIYKKDFPKKPCTVKGCTEMLSPMNKLGFCGFHYMRYKNGTTLTRPKGNSGSLNVQWKGGIAQYPNHSLMKRVRKEVLEEANYTCYYCGKPANQIHHKDLTRHNHVKNNLVACCHSCNMKRAKQSTSKFRRIYGKTVTELANLLDCSPSNISRYYKKYGNLTKLSTRRPHENPI